MNRLASRVRKLEANVMPDEEPIVLLVGFVSKLDEQKQPAEYSGALAYLIGMPVSKVSIRPGESYDAFSQRVDLITETWQHIQHLSGAEKQEHLAMFEALTASHAEKRQNHEQV